MNDVQSICLVCEGQEWNRYLTLGNYEIIKCQRCGLGQTYPFPSGEQQSEVNQDVYTLENRLRAYNTRFEEFFARYTRQLTEIKSHLADSAKNLLDVGCSLGFFLVTAQKMGFDVHGIELSKESADYASKVQNLKVFHGTLEDAKYLDGQFDVVTLWDVLEHVPDPRAMLMEINRILSPSGVIVIQSPNMDSLMAAKGRDYWNWWLVPDHIYHFTPSTLRNFVVSCNFTISTSYTWEPSLDFLVNWLSATFRVKNRDASLKARSFRKVIRIASRLFWPVVVPIQRNAWKDDRGALTTIFARKMDKNAS
jgi:SAM-dependent methyltransferase